MLTSCLPDELGRLLCPLLGRLLVYGKRRSVTRLDALVCHEVDDVANRVSVIAVAVRNFLHRVAQLVLFANGQHSISMQLFTHAISLAARRLARLACFFSCAFIHCDIRRPD